jgi:hypothetical protein
MLIILATQEAEIGLKPARANSLQDLISEKPPQKKADGVSQE